MEFLARLAAESEGVRNPVRRGRSRLWVALRQPETRPLRAPAGKVREREARNAGSRAGGAERGAASARRCCGCGADVPREEPLPSLKGPVIFLWKKPTCMLFGLLLFPRFS